MAKDPRLTWTISDYLCTECKVPLYFEVGNESLDICPNGKCILHEPGLEFQDLSKADTLREEMKEKWQDLCQRIAQTSQLSFIEYLFKERDTLVLGSVRSLKIEFRKILAIDDLLIHVCSDPPLGKQDNLSVFSSILSDYNDLFIHTCFVEDMENERYLFSTEKKVYVLKYWPAILSFLRTHGIVSGMDRSISEAFGYHDIEQKAKEKVELRIGEDWAKHFQQMFDFIINLGYMFEYQYLTAKQHKYDPTGIDLATLLGLWASTQQEIEAWNLESVKKHFDRTSGGQESFGNFHEKYMSGKSLAPVMVFNGRDYLVGRWTTLLYFLYSVGINKRLSIGQIRSGGRDIAAKREEASLIFEARVREQLKKSGFRVLDDSLKVKEQNEEHEYDAIGVNEASSQVIIVEAKYRDFAPSSISGKTLIKQELTDEDRLLDWASDAQSKLEFFRKYGSRFKRELSLNKETKDYESSIWVVTKHKPLISKYHSVRILDFPQFCQDASKLLRKAMDA
jgi:hypothetical protein